MTEGMRDRDKERVVMKMEEDKGEAIVEKRHMKKRGKKSKDAYDNEGTKRRERILR